jgi:pantothenate kinase
MKGASVDQDTLRVCELIEERGQASRRTIVAIAGPPASGKSTLAENVVNKLNQDASSEIPKAVLLPLDGYHLDNRILEASGLLARKGAPETFDSVGFCEAIYNVATSNRKTYHPLFDRRLDLSVAKAIEVHPSTEIIVVEGNYLLLERYPWISIRKEFALTVFVNPPKEVLCDRLQERWVQHGLEPAAANLRVAENDMVNAELVVQCSSKADLEIFRGDYQASEITPFPSSQNHQV